MVMDLVRKQKKKEELMKKRKERVMNLNMST